MDWTRMSSQDSNQNQSPWVSVVTVENRDKLFQDNYLLKTNYISLMLAMCNATAEQDRSTKKFSRSWTVGVYECRIRR